MTAFVRETFNIDREWVSYGQEHEFVARFKYGRSGKASFVTFLIKNFTTEEYFGALKEGGSPGEVLQAKGYMSPHVKKAVKRGDMVQTQLADGTFDVSITQQYRDTMDAMMKRASLQKAARDLAAKNGMVHTDQGYVRQGA
jgi:hypothetical protein